MSKPDARQKIAVLGGGITGLTAAYELGKHPDRFEVVLFEASARLGGKIGTEHRDGFLIEQGPDSFITDKPHGIDLCRDIGLEDQLQPCNTASRNIYIVRDGQPVLFPGGMRLTIPTKFGPFLRSPVISFPGKMRMLMDLWIPPRREKSDESLGSFIRRRFGSEALERLAGPMMAGIYVSDPDRMSMASTFPLFVKMEQDHGSLIRAARKPPATAASTPRPKAMFYSLAGGMQQLPDRLRKCLTCDVRTGTEIEAVHPATRAGYRLSGNSGGDRFEEQVDGILCTLPAPAASRILQSLDPDMSASLGRMRTVSTAVVTVAYRRNDIRNAHRLDGFGLLCPRPEGYNLIASTWSSVKFSGRAPDDHILMRAFLGGPFHEDTPGKPDGELLDLVQREYRELLGIRAEPVITRIDRWLNANPQYDVGHADWLDELDRLCSRHPGLQLAGSSYRGVGIPDCIAGAKRAADSFATSNDQAA